MAGWTPERRQRQAELIRTWKPWTRSTGPRTVAGLAKATRNLPWNRVVFSWRGSGLGSATERAVVQAFMDLAESGRRKPRG